MLRAAAKNYKSVIPTMPVTVTLIAIVFMKRRLGLVASLRIFSFPVLNMLLKTNIHTGAVANKVDTRATELPIFSALKNDK